MFHVKAYRYADNGSLLGYTLVPVYEVYPQYVFICPFCGAVIVRHRDVKKVRCGFCNTVFEVGDAR